MAPARSVKVVVKNYSSSKLERTSVDLPHGIWNELPPENISSSSKATWGSESEGILTS